MRSDDHNHSGAAAMGTAAGARGDPTLLINAPSAHVAQLLRSGLTDSSPSTTVQEGKATGQEAAAGSAAQVLMGLAHGWREEMRPGDLIVATEALGMSDGVRSRSADILAGELRRCGFTVHVGPLWAGDPAGASGADGQGNGQGQKKHTRKSALGTSVIDMAAVSPDAAVGLVYVVEHVTADGESDNAGRLRVEDTFVRLGPPLQRWALATGPRQVLLAGPRSLCAGVERAIEIVERALELFPHPIYVRKQIVHNLHVVRDLEQRGVIFVDEVEEVPVGAVLIFSAHGVSPAVREAASSRQLQVIDATCPLVTKVHSKARRFINYGDTVVLIGHEGHEETEGTLGQSPGNIVLVRTAEDIPLLQLPDPSRVAYVTQTTLAIDEAEELADELRAHYPELHEQGSEDICYATTNRQNAVRAVADESDLILVVGSANSSNSVRMVEIAQRTGTPAHLIDGASDIECSWLNGVRTVGLSAGASAPAVLLNAVIDNLRGLGVLQVTERVVTQEDIQFTLPKEVRYP